MRNGVGRKQHSISRNDWEATLFGNWTQYFNDAVVGGRRLRYLDVGNGPPILLVHGLGASWRVWCHNLTALVEEHRVIVVDLPGFGDSQNLAGSIRLDDYSAALAGLLDALGIDAAVVVGHSLGGLICQRLAAQHPSHVTGLVLVSTTGGELTARARVLFQAVALGTVPLGFVPRALIRPALQNVMAVPSLRRWLLSRMVHDPGQVAPDLAVAMISSAVSSRGTAAAIRAGLRVLPENDLGAITCPVLIVSGDADRITTVAAAADLARRLPQATRVTWRGVGHHPMWERPQDFDELLRSFLTEHDIPA